MVASASAAQASSFPPRWCAGACCGWPLGRVTYHRYRYEWVYRAIYWTDHVQDYACRYCQHTWRVDRSKVVYSENHAM